MSEPGLYTWLRMIEGLTKLGFGSVTRRRWAGGYHSKLQHVWLKPSVETLMNRQSWSWDKEHMRNSIPMSLTQLAFWNWVRSHWLYRFVHYE